jgi:hypothetical protein
LPGCNGGIWGFWVAVADADVRARGYMLGVSERYDFSLPTPGVGYSHDTSIYQRKEFAYVLGVGYRLPQGLSLEVRYVAGLTDLYDKNGRSFYSTYTD